MRLQWYILEKSYLWMEPKVVGQGADAAAIAANRSNKQVTFNNCALFTDCVSEINNTHVDNAKTLILWCQCIIWQNALIIIQKHQDVYDSIVEIKQIT